MVALVLLPGLDGTGLLFDEFAAALGSDADVIIASYPVQKLLGYAELESIARSFIPSANPFFLLGESFSGPIALSIAASPPPNLLGVILCCSFARNPLPMLAPARVLLRHLPVAPPVSLLNFFLLGRFSTEKLRTRLARVLAMVAPEVLRERALAALSVDESTRLGHVRAPLLYLRARQDRVVGRRSAEQILAGVPDAQMLEFAAPHFLLQVIPEACAATVSEFMRAHTTKSP
ncbi:MAG TPA: alpha/beta fold hydrolase [Gammaproteobacteria bacterium]